MFKPTKPGSDEYCDQVLSLKKRSRRYIHVTNKAANQVRESNEPTLTDDQSEFRIKL